ncbi:MAG: hypothetical protein KBS95_08475 [Alistipes sp.]|nr:hypothetical protein [Candidatus Alistipes equi]
MKDCEFFDEQIFKEHLTTGSETKKETGGSKKIYKIISSIMNFMFGKILSSNTTSNIMKSMLYISMLWLGCIFLSMWCFSVGINVNNSQKELEDIKARHLRLRTELYSRSTYHEILREVDERHLELELPTTPPYCY